MAILLRDLAGGGLTGSLLFSVCALTYSPSCSLLTACQGAVVVLFAFTLDDSLFPRYALDRSRTAVSQRNAASQTYQDGSTQPTGDTKKEPSIDPLDRQTTVNDGDFDFLPRNYWQVLAPIHYFKEDRTTWWQYFRRPFHLFAFPNIVIVRV